MNQQENKGGDTGCLVVIGVLILLALWSISDKMPAPEKPKTTAPAVKRAP